MRTQMSASRLDTAAFYDAHPVFRVEDFVRFHAREGGRSPATSATVLRNAVAAGRLLHLRRGLYAVVPRGVAPEDASVDRFLLASAHTPDAVIGFHAALELHGRAYSTWSRVHVWTEHRTKPWSWRGAEVVPVLVPSDLRDTPDAMAGSVVRAHAGGTVRVTTLERTLVDVLDQPDKGGSWEEILRSLAMIEFVDVEAVVAHALRLGRALTAARVGWFLSRMREAWHVDAAQLDTLRDHRPATPTHLDARRSPGRVDTVWNLVVPHDLAFVATEGSP